MSLVRVYHGIIWMIPAISHHVEPSHDGVDDRLPNPVRPGFVSFKGPHRSDTACWKPGNTACATVRE